MGNRHHHKKLRAEVRARMARTGESYQRALARIQSERAESATGTVDLLPIEYFGTPAALATFDIAGRLACIVVSNRYVPRPFPTSPMFALASFCTPTVH
jgi:hypothetical protein